MAKERSEKKDKKEKKEKRSETDGVTKKSKKDKKEKKSKSEAQAGALVEDAKVAVPVKEEKLKKEEDSEMEDEQKEEKIRISVPKEALVPFANPLADDKQTKKLLKSVKKANKNKTLKRGVKEVVKAIRKSGTPTTTKQSTGVVILAADISPMDVISHIPVLCEDHNIPYIYVTSRLELGAAGNTKRPTSVVMISKERSKKAAKEDDEATAEYAEVYSDLVKMVLKAGATVKI